MEKAPTILKKISRGKASISKKRGGRSSNLGHGVSPRKKKKGGGGKGVKWGLRKKALKGEKENAILRSHGPGKGDVLRKDTQAGGREKPEEQEKFSPPQEKRPPDSRKRRIRSQKGSNVEKKKVSKLSE